MLRPFKVRGVCQGLQESEINEQKKIKKKRKNRVLKKTHRMSKIHDEHCLKIRADLEKREY